MAGFKPYPEYKDSGIEWVGKIPEEWDIRKYKRVFTFLNGHGFPDELQGLEEGEIPFLKVSDIGFPGKYVKKARNYVSSLTVKYHKWREVDSYSIITAKIGEALRKNHRKINLKTCVIDNNMMALTPNGADNLDFLYYTLNVVDFDWYSNPGAVPSLNNGHLREDYLMIPSFKEQKFISKFLHRKTSEIDALISDKERLIELLEEKRQAVITETVTKGLDPNVAMKDSGIEWIGEIPEHWVKSKLKYLSKQIIDGTHNTPTYVESGIPFLRVTDLTGASGNELKKDHFKYIPENEHKQLIKRCNPQKGDLLLSKNGTIGIPRVVDWDFEFSIFVSLCLIKFNKSKINPYYCSYFFESKLVDQQIAYGGKKSTITNLHLDKIKEFFLFLPPIDEQNTIVSNLKVNVMKYDSLIDNITKQISKLKEYRESLVYEAVTGKIDVRDYAAELETEEIH